MCRKVGKLSNLWEEGKSNYSLVRYLPGLATVSRQGQMYTIMPKKAYALTNYTEKKMLDFNILIASNTYTNYSSLIIVLPIQIKKATDASADIDATSIIVNNNFYAH